LAAVNSKAIDPVNDRQMSKTKYYRLAVASSLISKFGTTLVQLLITPLAAIALGVEGFALYVMLIAASGWLAIVSLGLGPVLSVQVARNVIDGTPQREQAIVASAFWTSLGLSLLAATVSAVVVLTIPVSQIFGSQFERHSGDVIFGYLLLTAVYVLQVNLSIFEAVQAGLQRQHTTNLVVALGALVTLPIVFVVADWRPTPASFLVAGLLPTLVLRLAHALWMCSKRMSILPRWQSFDIQVVKLLLSSGAVYSLAGSAGNFISHALPTILIGRVLDAVETGAFAATMHLIILLSGVTAMLVSPAVPVIASSLAQRDHGWVQNAYNKLLLGSMGVAFVAAAVLVLAGDQIFEVWMRGTVQPDRWLLVSAGAYFLLSTWEVVHFSLAVAMQKAVIASWLVFSRSVAGATLTVIILPSGGAGTAYIAMCIAVLLVNSVPLYLLVRSGIRAAK
jgi:O-antigen/teichoic acid export membrane protein